MLYKQFPEHKGMTFFNGADELISDTQKWEFMTNYRDCYLKQTVMAIQHSGLKCMICNKATDCRDDLLPDCFSLYFPEGIDQRPEINQFFANERGLREAYEQRLIRKGVVPEDYFSWKRPCYVGCEKEYGLTLPDDF